MVNIKDWLESNYPNKEDITEIDSKNQPLEGELELENFPKLEKVNLSGGKGLTKVTITNCPDIWHINIGDNVIEEIIGHNELKNLQWLEISRNKVTDQNIIAKNDKLVIFACVGNPIENKQINWSVDNRVIHFAGGIGGESVFLSTEEDYRRRLKEIAGKLGIKDDDLENKTNKQVEDLVNNKASEVKDGDKLNKDGLDAIGSKFPGLIKDDGKVDRDKLNEIENQADKGKELDGLGLTIEEVKKLKSLVELLVGDSKQVAKVEMPVKI